MAPDAERRHAAELKPDLELDQLTVFQPGSGPHVMSRRNGKSKTDSDIEVWACSHQDETRTLELV